MKPKPWLITGGAGFLGQALVKQLLSREFSVVVLDNFSWGNKNIRNEIEDAKLQIYTVDIRDTTKVKWVLKKERPYYVVHLAAFHFIPDALKFPDEVVSINIEGTRNLLEACLNSSVQTFWYASTADVYSSSNAALHERSLTCPQNIYGHSKLVSEQWIKTIVKTRKAPCCVIGRLFNLYGKGDTIPHLIPEVVKQLKRDPLKPIKLGALWPKRDFVSVDDAATAVIQTSLVAKAGLTTFNIGSGVALSVKEIISTMESVLGRTISIEEEESRIRSVERPYLLADIRKLKTHLGWGPHANFFKGLSDLMRHEGLIT